MCGILGLFRIDKNAASLDPRLIERMRDTMAHRGPDAGGLYISPNQEIALAHRRLSIIDLSNAASQPMNNQADNLQLVFNGEIYNHAEIRQELENQGVRFRTDHSDTEVILKGYETWGENILPKLRGMFAFVIWDARKKLIWLVRDRMGVKPIYYTTASGYFLFASEIKALLPFPGVARGMDDKAFYDYLTFVVAPPPNTLFKGIHKIPASHHLTVNQEGRITSVRYWNPFMGTESLLRASEEECAERLMHTLRDSVRYRMVSDVNFGAFLSGGIDSSTNVALMAERMDRPVDTFSLGFKSDAYQNELDYARMIRDRYKTRHHEVMVGAQDFMEFLPKLILHQDEPIADPVCVPIYFLAKLAKENNTTVCQVGEGADELFLGYPHWAKILKMSDSLSPLGKIFRPFRSPLEKFFLSSPLIPWSRMRHADVLRRIVSGEPIFWGAESYQETAKQRFLSDSFLKQLGGYSSFEPIKNFRREFEADAPEGADELHWMSYLDLRFRLPELILMRVDKMTMAESIEGRVPFLDQEFVKLAMAMPRDIKFKNQNLKHILKKAVRSLLPDEIIDRPKQGFAVPLDDWFQGRLRGWVHGHVMDFVQRTNYFDRTQIEDFLQKTGGLTNWYLLNLTLWHEKWVEGRDVQLPIGP